MPHYARWRARLARLFASRIREHRLSSEDSLKLLVVVEGVHDIEFLRRISAMLHAHEPTLPDLGSMEHRGELIFLPFGGVDQKAWTHRLAPLAKPEFHICDREESPEMEQRKQLADSVNSRPGCRAVVTSKRSMENYLHPAAIREASGMEISFADDDDVAGLIARKIEKLGQFYLSPGIMTEEMHLFRATNLIKTDQEPEEGITVVKMRLSQAIDKVKNGEIIDAKTICGLFWVAWGVPQKEMY